MNVSDGGSKAKQGRLLLRESPESWLLGAFLVFFSVAVAAALPPISASIRTALADAAKSPQSKAEVEHRATVRAQSHALRALQAKSGGNDVLPQAAPFAFLPVDGASSLPRTVDLAQRIHERGFSARAPPLA